MGTAASLSFPIASTKDPSRASAGSSSVAKKGSGEGRSFRDTASSTFAASMISEKIAVADDLPLSLDSRNLATPSSRICIQVALSLVRASSNSLASCAVLSRSKPCGVELIDACIAAARASRAVRAGAPLRATYTSAFSSLPEILTGVPRSFERRSTTEAALSMWGLVAAWPATP